MKKCKTKCSAFLCGLSLLLFPVQALAAEQTMQEKLSMAVQNTILGIGTVFIMLVLISLVIYCFRFIPKLVDSMTKKEEPKAPEKKEAPKAAPKVVAAPAPAPVSPMDDLELVAVIMAAISASQEIPLDGFVVRTIKKRA